MLPRICISILIYQSEKYLDDLFGSLAKIHYPKERVCIFVNVNASPDRSGEIFEREILPKYQGALPAVHMYRPAANEGFAGGHNSGAKFALDHKYEYLYLLNSDAVVDPDFLNEAVAVAEANPRLAVVQSLFMGHPGTGKLNGIGNALHFTGMGYTMGNGKTLEDMRSVLDAMARRDPPYAVGYAGGAGILARASFIRENGLFDPHLFLYHEDTELSLQAWLTGWQVALAPRSVIYHLYEFTRSIKNTYWIERNRWMVMLATFRAPTLLLIAPVFFALELGLIIFSIKSGWFYDKMRVYAYFLTPKNWTRLIAKRRAFAGRRTMPDRTVTRFMVGRIDFQAVNNPLLRIANPIMAAYWWVMEKIIFW